MPINLLDKSVSPQKDEYTIPKIIHFIWAGGKKLLSDKDINVIKEWAENNKDYQIWLWIDKKTAPKDKDLEKIYKDKFSNINILVKDITEEKVVTDSVRYEIDRIDPNYGASSDILRYNILHKYGGCYFDSDVSPGKTPLSIPEKTQGHVVYLDHLSQMPNPPEEALKYFQFSGKIGNTNNYYGVGNDSFICTKNNPFIEALKKNVEKNYTSDDNNLIKKIAFSGHDIKNITIEKTGPTLVLNTIMKDMTQGERKTKGIDNWHNDIECNGIINNLQIKMKPIRCESYEFTKPLSNTKNWLDVPLDMPDDEEKNPSDWAIQKIIETIRYELINLNIIRLDDHVRNITTIANKIGVNPDDIVDKLLEELNNLNFDNVKVAQSISNNQKIINFYQSKNIKTTENTIDTFNLLTSKSLFSVLVTFFNDKKTDTLDKLIQLNVYKSEQVKGFYDRLLIGIEYIDKLTQSDSNSRFIMIHESEIKNILSDYKKTLSEFKAHLNLEKQDKIEEKIQSLTNKVKEICDDNTNINSIFQAILGNKVPSEETEAPNENTEDINEDIVKEPETKKIKP